MSCIVSVPMAHPVFALSRWEDLDWVHKKVMQLFGPVAEGDHPRQEGKVLFRVEPRVRGGRVLVQSEMTPEASGVEVRDLAPVLNVLTAGTEVQFLTKVNPVRTVNRTGDDGVVRTKRAQVGPEALPEWLRQRLDGLELAESSLVITTGYERFRQTPFYVATCRGRGRVSDAGLLTQSILDGIGKGRSYGCGLVTVVPAVSVHVSP